MGPSSAKAVFGIALRKTGRNLDKENNPIYSFGRFDIGEVRMASLQNRLSYLETRIFAWKANYAFRRFMIALKAGFNPEQPRDEWGRWTSGGGVTVSTSPGFYTGIQSIDETSEALSDILVSVMDGLEFVPFLSPSAYGTFVHGLFGTTVRLRGLSGVGDIEQTFSLDDADPYYGMAGSIRTDVTLRNIQGDIIAIYDVKTGDTPLSRARADELRLKTRASPNTPVFELNIVRGISRKSICSQKRHSP